jgi:hypothetical protein
VLLVALALAADRLLDEPLRARVLVSRAAALITVALLVANGVAFAGLFAGARASGPGGLTAAEWRASGLVARVAELPADAIVFSNFPEAIRLHDRGRDARLLSDDVIANLATRLAPATYLAWFRGGHADYRADAWGLTTLQDLERRLRIRTTAACDDGVLLLTEGPRDARE